MLRITAATQAGGQPACIWSLAELPGGLLASASSRGVVQTFETQFGTQQSSCHHHQADVTCLAAAPGGHGLFAAGVDPSLVLLTPSQPAGSESDVPARFQFSDRRRPHSSDVRAMAVVTPHTHTHSGASKSKGSDASAALHYEAEKPSWLLTGSNDAQLLIHSAHRFRSMHPARVTAAPCVPVLAFSACGKFIAADGESLDLWKSADASSTHEKVRSRNPHMSNEVCELISYCLPLSLRPRTARAAHCMRSHRLFVVVLQGKSVAQEGEPITAHRPPALLARLATEPDRAAVTAALSPCGSFAAFSTSDSTTLLAVPEAAGKDAGPLGGIAAVRLQEPLPAANSLCFLGGSQKDQNAPNESWLLLGCMDGFLRCLHVDVTCESSLALPVTVPLPQEETLRHTASLRRHDSLASASTVNCEMMRAW